MTTFVMIEIRAKKGLGDELVSAFSNFAPVARREEGNLSIQLMQNQDDPDLLMFYQSWESREHQEKYLVRFEERGNYEILGPLLDGEPVVHYFEDTNI
tara:strand:- start:985 stop:1278 length:294 start_codon:yes stop_codon:yes gene_type:complete